MVISDGKTVDGNVLCISDLKYEVLNVCTFKFTLVVNAVCVDLCVAVR